MLLVINHLNSTGSGEGEDLVGENRTSPMYGDYETPCPVAFPADSSQPSRGLQTQPRNLSVRKAKQLSKVGQERIATPPDVASLEKHDVPARRVNHHRHVHHEQTTDIALQELLGEFLE